MQSFLSCIYSFSYHSQVGVMQRFIKSGKEVLNQLTCLVQMLVTTALVFARVARWDDDLLARFNQWLNDGLR